MKGRKRWRKEEEKRWLNSLPPFQKLSKKLPSALLFLFPCCVSSACLSRSTSTLLHPAVCPGRLTCTDCLKASFTLWFPGEAAAPCSLWGQWKILEADGNDREEWSWIIISWARRLWFINSRLYPSPKASAPVSWSRHNWTGAGESWKRAAPADSMVTAALFLNVSRTEVSVALREYQTCLPSTLSGVDQKSAVSAKLCFTIQSDT